MFNLWSFTTLVQYWSAVFLYAMIRMSNSFLVNTEEWEDEDGDLAPCRSCHSFFPEVSRLCPVSFPLTYSKLCFVSLFCSRWASVLFCRWCFSNCPSPPLRAAGAAEIVQCLIFLRSLSFLLLVCYKHTQALYFMSCEHHTWKWKMTACEIIQLKRS